MTDHPITPPPELVQQWNDQASYYGNTLAVIQAIATQAARWGSDQELAACCAWLERNFDDWDNRFSAELRATRRPKPPSLKEQALAALNEAVYMADDSPPEGISTDQADVIRRALNELPDE